VTNDYGYDAFGVQKTDANAGDTNPFRYCSEYFDNETGYVYLRARYMNPNTGRFLTEDPIKDGNNWYVYGNNNPLRFIDPWGLAAGDTYYVTGNNVAFRDNKGTTSNVLNRLDAGAQVTYTGARTFGKINGHIWYEVTYGGTTGWMSATYLSSAKPMTATATAETRRSLPPTGEPNSKDTLHNPDGTPKQERYYPDSGDVRVGNEGYDDDYNHAGDGHGIGFPHRHTWENGERSRNPVPVPNAEAIVKGVGTGVAVVGGGYLIYRGVRMLPSLAPPLWWTIPANVTIP